MPDREAMARLMSKRLPKQMMAFLLACGVQGESHGFHVHLVGGMVRDVLRDRPPGDPDLVVQETVPTMDAAPRFGALLAEALGGSVSAPSQFGTVKLEAGGLTVDVATARRETYESPGALPSVRPATIDGDMDRRDFTVNAISVDLAPGRFGTILDHHGGVDDVSGGFLVVLHDRSFSDDPTRALRAVRYEARLRLHMSMVTEDMVRRNLGHMEAVSGDRVRHEFERIFAEPAPEVVLARADVLGLLQAVLPGLTWSAAMSAAAPSLREAAPSLGTAGPTGYLALLASPLSPEDAEQLTERLNAPRPWAKVIEDTVLVWEQLPHLAPTDIAPSGVYDMLEGASPEAVLAWAVLSTGAVATRLRDYLDKLRHVRTLLTGDDLLALGVAQGPLVGELLRELLDARLDGLVASRGDEEALVRRRLSSQ